MLKQFAANERLPLRRLGRTWGVAAHVVVQVAVTLGLSPCGAVTPESPEVLAMVDRGLAFLETETDDRLGGKCIVALAFHKRGASASHPRIQEALEACRNSVEAEKEESRVYSKALAIIFLIETNNDPSGNLVRKYAEMMRLHQFEHGGFGYKQSGEFLGDTSQTQYAALAYWEMLQAGMAPEVDSIERCMNWLLKTQAPDGGWGYKGLESTSGSRVEQGSESPCMLSAGLSSLLIGANMLGMMTPHSGPSNADTASADAATAAEETLPKALRRAELGKTKKIVHLVATGKVKAVQLKESAALGKAWFKNNFDATNGSYFPHYSLYATERYKSFEEYLEGDAPEQPEWYDKGYAYLKETQEAKGNWTANAESTAATSTAFSVLFLLRSTRASIKERLGEGTLVGGRGLPRDLSKVRIRGGKLVVEQKPTELGKLRAR